MRKEQKMLNMTDRIMRYSNGEIPYFTAKSKAREYYDGKPSFVFGDWISGDKDLHASFEIAEGIMLGWADNPPEEKNRDYGYMFDERIAEKAWSWLRRHFIILTKISYINDVVQELAVNYGMTYKEAVQVVRKSPLEKCLRFYPEQVLHSSIKSIARDVVYGSDKQSDNAIDYYIHTVFGCLYLQEKMGHRSAYGLIRRYGLRNRLNYGEINAERTPVSDVVSAMLEWDKSTLR